MRNLWLVTKREYISRAKSSAYLITTLFMVLIFFGSTLLPAVFDSQSKAETLYLLLLDRTSAVAAPLQAALEQEAQQEGSRAVQVEVVSGEEGALSERARAENKALLVVEGSFPGGLKVRYLAPSPNLLMASHAVLGPLEGLVRGALMAEQGIAPTVLAQLMRPMEVEERQVGTRSGERDSKQFSGSLMLGMGAVMAVYIIVLLNGTFVFQGVLEEKVSRVLEVMAASVRPREMMLGKVLGLGALGLTQFVLMAVAWWMGSATAAKLSDIPLESPSVGFALAVLGYILLGFALSASLMAAAGSTVSRMEDGQTVLMPITMLQVLPMLMLAAVIGSPNSSLAVALSLIPFFSPTVMVLRMVLTDVPAWQIGLSMGLMLLTTWVMTVASIRVYRAAMLSYGGRPSLRQIWQYLKVG